MSYVRASLFRLVPGSFFQSVGKGTRFFGWPSFGTCNGNVVIGERSLIGRQLFVSAGKNCQIRIGNDCSINTGGHLVALYGIFIGNETRIGEFVSIRDQNHGIEDHTASVAEQGYTGGPIMIGNKCWIGRGVFIGPNVTIGDGGCRCSQRGCNQRSGGR